jgi:hypothetical protein
LYYARGSLYEARFSLRRAYTRNLLDVITTEKLAELIRALATALNNFPASIKQQRAEASDKKLKDSKALYNLANPMSEHPYEGDVDTLSYSHTLRIHRTSILY